MRPRRLRSASRRLLGDRDRGQHREAREAPPESVSIGDADVLEAPDQAARRARRPRVAVRPHPAAALRVPVVAPVERRNASIEARSRAPALAPISAPSSSRAGGAEASSRSSSSSERRAPMSYPSGSVRNALSIRGWRAGPQSGSRRRRASGASGTHHRGTTAGCRPAPEGSMGRRGGRTPRAVIADRAFMITCSSGAQPRSPANLAMLACSALRAGELDADEGLVVEVLADRQATSTASIPAARSRWRPRRRSAAGSPACHRLPPRAPPGRLAISCRPDVSTRRQRGPCSGARTRRSTSASPQIVRFARCRPVEVGEGGVPAHAIADVHGLGRCARCPRRGR